MTDSYMYAALVLHKAGKKVDEAGLTSVVKAAGVDVDQVNVKATLPVTPANAMMATCVSLMKL